RLRVYVDQAPEDPFSWYLSRHVEGGDVKAALDAAIADALEEMRPLEPEEIEEMLTLECEEIDELQRREYEQFRRLSYDVVIICGGRVLAVIKFSPGGGIVHRFDRS